MTIDEHERQTMLDPLGPQPGDDATESAADERAADERAADEGPVTAVDLDTPPVADDRPTMVDGDAELEGDAEADGAGALPAGSPRRPKADLTGSQRKRLRGLAHHLDALVRVGKEGLTEGTAGAVSDALDRHELIKVRVLEGAPLDRREVAVGLATACGAHVVGQVGRIVILYRRHPEKPQIPLR